MTDRMIVCPYCDGTKEIVVDEFTYGCTACDDGTIPDRRSPTANDRAVERIKEITYTHRCEVTGEFSRGYGLAMGTIADIIREEAGDE